MASITEDDTMGANNTSQGINEFMEDLRLTPAAADAWVSLMLPQPGELREFAKRYEKVGNKDMGALCYQLADRVERLRGIPGQTDPDPAS
jgi:hypothetical protein